MGGRTYAAKQAAIDRRLAKLAKWLGKRVWRGWPTTAVGARCETALILQAARELARECEAP